MQTLTADAFVSVATPPPLGDDEVHVWLIESATAQRAPALSVAAHATLGWLLARYVGEDAGPPAIARGPHGKPYVPLLPELEFNLSHSGRCTLIALARGQAVGVDVERSDRCWSVDGIARRYFTASESRALAQVGDGERANAFLSLWTCKEAVLKAIGSGISFGLDRVEFALSTNSRVDRLVATADEAGTPAEWEVCAIEPSDGYFGAVAWRGPKRSVRTLRAAPMAATAFAE
ncbi:MAG: 4'-phosphopantetheinyl transferase superfamily protein [Dokdonella sp.]